MDREKRSIRQIFSKISPVDLLGSEVQSSELIYNVVSFISSSDFCDNAFLISNLGFLLAQKGLYTCIVDFKVFYPNIYLFLDVPPHKKSDGLIKVLKSDKVDFREEIQPTKFSNLFLLSPSPQDLIEEYLDFTFDHIDHVINNLKQMFDIVLIDVPNNPPLEFCLGAMKSSHIGFFTAAERLECPGNIIKLLDFAASIGISTSKFTSVILMNMLDLTFDYKVFTDAGLKIVACLPLVKQGYARALDGRLYVKDNPMINKYFDKHMDTLVKLLVDGNKGG